ncbi:ADP-ribosylglycohydrolase family protein [Nocardia sp. NBC_01329]|uniref:ADP-ribosylglycohydrolase family protein n=1 Tax=Nocardia sp. NBC_01329 TaxID=2903594 RepID=UPI002E0E7CCE|nr:ADP-ribosylglycohydrolase family protein [Nocardia sp. NBC_01329]
MHIDSMLDSLAGLSVGDALGQQFPVMRRSLTQLRAGELPTERPWAWTDDTEMACSVVAELLRNGSIDQDRLAAAFARRFQPHRDYGFNTVGVLRRIGAGAHWRDVAGALFENQGSRGNGAAMRVAPLGAFYAGDPGRAAAEAARSAEVTHMHPEGVAGAVAVALAAAGAARARLAGNRPGPAEFVDSVLGHLGDSETRGLIRRARSLLGASTQEAANELGNGSRVTAQDTVPFTIWAAATHLGDYPAAVATCIEADGDIDTTGAIVGGIVAAHTGDRPGTGVPQWWLAAREPLPGWFDPDRRPPRPSRFARVRRRLAGPS